MRRLAALLPVVVLVAAACSGGEGPPTPSPSGEPAVAQEVEEGGIPQPGRSWNTDWSRRSIDLGEVVVGLGGEEIRDRIAPLDGPSFDSVGEASQWLVDREPVVLLELGGEARAYPIQILTWHEIVNDEVVGEPVAVTFCPLCNTAVAFRRTVDGRVLRLGTSGLLRNSDLVMWDRQTESLWQQVTGEAIVGELTGRRLEFVPSSIVRWADFKERFPDGKVLSRQTGYQRAYGFNPYEAYDSAPRPFLFRGEADDRYAAMERVVGVTANDSDKAYPFSVIALEGVVNDAVGGVPIVVFWGAEDTASALDARNIAEGRSVGVGVAYLRSVGGRVLTFEAQGEDTFVDRETGSTWGLLGKAVAGPLAGEALELAAHANHFWFAWAAFNPDSPVYAGR